MTRPSALERGRRAFQGRAWAAAYESLRAADEEAPLAAEDLERAGQAAYLTGRYEDCLGGIPEGIAVLDEVMVGVTGGEASAIVARLVYCG